MPVMNAEIAAPVKGTRFNSTRCPFIQYFPNQLQVGDGDLRERLQHLVRELGVSAEFLGALSATGVLQQLHLAQVLCLPA